MKLSPKQVSSRSIGRCDAGTSTLDRTTRDSPPSSTPARRPFREQCPRLPATSISERSSPHRLLRVPYFVSCLLLATTVLGFVLDNNPSLREDIVDTAVAQIPVIGSEVLVETGGLTGSSLAIVIGVVGAVWGATRAFVALQSALDDIWEVPLDERHNLVIRRVHGLVGLLVIAAGQVGTVVLTSIAGYAEIGFISQSLITLGTVAVNTAIIGTMFRYLTAAPATWNMVRVGAVLAGFGFTLLQFAGTSIVARLLSGAQGVYGAFASVLALTRGFHFMLRSRCSQPRSMQFVFEHRHHQMVRRPISTTSPAERPSSMT